ncbi:MAG: hypothetical protein KDA50_02470 [Rhodobacteraceae bacterium]|nr:hypothetical protein [Paracoccaceae bacterium]
MAADPRPRFVPLWRAALLCVALAWAWAGAAAVLDLSPGQDAVDLRPHLRYGADRSADLATMLGRFRAGGFDDRLRVNTLETNYAPEAWAALDLVNASFDDGRLPDPFSILIELPLVSEVDIYLVRDDGLTESLLDYSIFAPFDPAQHSVARLRSAVFRLAPQERATVLVNFKFGPFQSFRMSLETPPQIESRALIGGVGLTAFYAFSLACLLFFVAFYVALKDWISLLFALNFIVGLGFISYIDGLAFRFFYPARPDLQSPIGFFFLYALSMSGFLLAAHGLAVGGVRKLARWVRAASLVSVAGYAMALVSPGTYSATLGYGLLGSSFVAVLFGNKAWRRRQGPTHALAWWMTVASTLAIVALIGLVASGVAQAWLQIPQAIKIVYLVLMVSTIVSFTAHVLSIRRDHALAVAAKLEALEQEAARSRELLLAEQNYNRARDLARLRQRQLATASHDLKQPLTSLRMTLDSLGGQMDPALRSRMAEAFDYMEALSGEYLRDAAPGGRTSDGTGDAEAEDGPPVTAGASDAAADPYALSLILQTVRQMFGEEAVSKGLRFDIVDSSLQTVVPPLAVMRIVSNLAANAVKYTHEGRVLAGVRRRGSRAEIWVCDTGPGMSAAEIADFRREGRKGTASDGHGLGLAVCFGLAQDHGLNLDLRSAPGRGTVFHLSLPVL